jgi:hypothetical protein
LKLKLLQIMIAVPCLVLAQDASQPVPPQTDSAAPDPLTVAGKWTHFEQETVSPFTLAAGGFNAAVSQATRSAPLYGRSWIAYPKRFGASIGDLVSENFFGDFLLDSAFHEDPRYFPRGPSHGFWPRIGYAISRSIVTRTDAGNPSFNFGNVLGTAMSAGLSNAYYPPVSRTVRVSVTNWGTSIAGSGLAHLLPEFLPDCKAWLKRHKLSH